MPETKKKTPKKPVIKQTVDDIDDLDELIAQEQNKPKKMITIKDGGTFVAEPEAGKKVTFDDILQVRLEYDTEVIVDQDLTKILDIPYNVSITQIQEILAESAQLQARWNLIYNEIQHYYELEKLHFEVWEAERREFYRKKISVIQKPTDKKVNDCVMVEPEYIQRLKILTKLRRDSNSAKSIAIAFATRADKAVSISYLLRKEMETISQKNVI